MKYQHMCSSPLGSLSVLPCPPSWGRYLRVEAKTIAAETEEQRTQPASERLARAPVAAACGFAHHPQAELPHFKVGDVKRAIVSRHERHGAGRGCGVANDHIGFKISTDALLRREVTQGAMGIGVLCHSCARHESTVFQQMQF